VPLTSVISATARWLVAAYPADGGAFGQALALAQARQAATVASWLRYPTVVDAHLVHLVGPGGSAGLDLATDALFTDEVWRSWVDEVVASWAACLLSEPALAERAVVAAGETEHASLLRCDFQRLIRPDQHDHLATALLRHRDLVEPVARIHRASLMHLLSGDSRTTVSS
jgi:hypothetical protein